MITKNDIFTAEVIHSWAMTRLEEYQPYSDYPIVQRVSPTIAQAKEYIECAQTLQYALEGHYPEGVKHLSFEEVEQLLKKDEHFQEMALDMRDIVFSINGKYGLQRVTGEVVVPAIFDGIPERYNYIFELQSGEYGRCIPVIRNNKYALCKMDGNGTLVTDFIYDKIYRYFYSRNIYFVVIQDGKKGLIYNDGEVAIPCEMDEIYGEYHGIIPFKKGNKLGLFDYIATAPIFDDILIECEEYVQVKQGNKWYYIDIGGNPTSEKDRAIFEAYPE